MSIAEERIRNIRKKRNKKQKTFLSKGLGKIFVELAFRDLNVEYVDVNEQNPDAVKFYERMGFRTFHRDATDDQGNPFPILRMKK